MRNKLEAGIKAQTIKIVKPLPPLWVIFLILGTASLLFGAFTGYLHWINHRPLDWWGTAFEALWLFFINAGVQLWVRHWIKTHSATKPEPPAV